MDIYYFDCLSEEDKWEYFWDNSELSDSILGVRHDIFLFKDIYTKDLFFELKIDKLGIDDPKITMLSNIEASIKFVVPHQKAELPWA